MPTWLEAAAVALTVAYTPPTELDDYELVVEILVCPDISSLLHLFWTTPDTLGQRVLEHGCYWYPEYQIEFVSTTTVFIHFDEITVSVLKDRVSGHIIYTLEISP
jgi:hypothetical protein